MHFFYVGSHASEFQHKSRVTEEDSLFDASLFRNVAQACGIHLIQTSAYHPQSNGLIETVHRTLKAAPMCHEDHSWIEALPWVLLGLRSAVKEDLKNSSAELTYGEPLRLPGQFFKDHTGISTTTVMDKLHKIFRNLKPQPTSSHSPKKSFIHKDLDKSSHVFIRQDMIKPTLTQPYEGPYKVLERGDKTFKLDVLGQPKSFSKDRLKPAYTTAEECTTAEHVTSEKYTTRRGRQVRFQNYKE
ncbi:uncharacterized protein LOC113391255 [Ctenocephalides felis]|uniref:uncharacterized protein LOC113391255 n=1 Tax=Ctenocephalides felis TaxID=7515 RepID=UPI000E6E3A2F|nr:uncharacterized protein LOC113391255 [Ctenocephalides felis]